jgi:hypothetical protein
MLQYIVLMLALTSPNYVTTELYHIQTHTCPHTCTDPDLLILNV